MELFKPQMTRIKDRIVHACHLLPAFDEYFVAYKERSWKALGPTIIINGEAAGTWKRDSATITVKLLRDSNKSEQRALTAAQQRYVDFLQEPRNDEAD